jgi:hypothetical protein
LQKKDVEKEKSKWAFIGPTSLPDHRVQFSVLLFQAKE